MILKHNLIHIMPCRSSATCHTSYMNQQTSNPTRCDDFVQMCRRITIMTVIKVTIIVNRLVVQIDKVSNVVILTLFVNSYGKGDSNEKIDCATQETKNKICVTVLKILADSRTSIMKPMIDKITSLTLVQVVVVNRKKHKNRCNLCANKCIKK